ncbi:centromere protein S [Stegastes partitus]|uniref:Centromere protein S n=1 Tax=Stegastes partitus TaxID=144197 RepID=A0A3B4ZJE6_9TELE|nr:PREDICTED: centromere protein S-like [Stegastes partitus]
MIRFPPNFVTLAQLWRKSRCFQLVGSKLPHSKMSVDTDETHQRLKAAVHYTVGRLCQKVGEEHRREFSRQVVAAIAETAFRQCDVFAKDLEAFARHAKRSTVNAEDVKLVARRSTALSIYIQNKSEELTQEQRDLKKKSTGKRKSRDTEEDSRE